jgi:hypothetical protein
MYAALASDIGPLLAAAAPSPSPGAFTLPAGLAPATSPTAYFDVNSGVLQLDPAGLDISLVNFTFNEEVANVSVTTPGPFIYTGGTDNPGAVSTETTARTFPAGKWSLLTTTPARLAGVTTLVNDPRLATSGANIASTNGWFNRPWSFGSVIAPKSLTVATAQHNFIAQTPLDVGFGAGRDVFHYTASGVTGSQYGRVIVVDSSQPAAVNAIVGVAGDGMVISRSTGTALNTAPLTTLPAGNTWVSTVAGDFDGDGRGDVATQNSAGTWWVTLTPASGTAPATPWATLATFQFPTVGDFNGDGRADIAVRNAANGAWRVLASTGSAFTSSKFGSWTTAAGWSNVRGGDFNGDGKTDLVGQREGDGHWWTSLSNGTSFSTSDWSAAAPLIAWQLGTQFATVGDFNGDGRSDVAVRNADTGVWRVLSSTGSSFTSSRVGTWAANVSWDAVRGGDFNGDGRTDIAGQRTSDGTWFVSLSTGTSFTTSAWAVLSVSQFATVGDFNGDGRADIAVRNAANGAWRLLASNGSSFSHARFGDWPTGKSWSRALGITS